LSQGREAVSGVVARGQRARRGEAAHAQRRDGALGAAGDHHVGVAVFDQAAGLADAVQPGGAGRHDGQVGPGEAVADRDVARDHVDDRGRHEERRDAARAAFAVLVVRVLDQRQPADARADDAADALGHLLAERGAGGQTGVLHRLHRSRQPVMDEGVHVAGFLGWNM
jgi:hypothetical protein